MKSKGKKIKYDNITTLGVSCIYVLALLFVLFVPGELFPDTWVIANGLKNFDHTLLVVAFIFVVLFLICFVGEAMGKDIRLAITIFLGLEVDAIFFLAVILSAIGPVFGESFFIPAIICLFLNVLFYVLLVYGLFHKEINCL